MIFDFDFDSNFDFDFDFEDGVRWTVDGWTVFRYFDLPARAAGGF
jgi:hypothetical protein